MLALDFLTAIDLGPPELVSAAESTGCSWVSLLVEPIPILPDYYLKDRGVSGQERVRLAVEGARRVITTAIATD